MTRHMLLAAALIALITGVAGAPTLARRNYHVYDGKWTYDRCDKLFGPASWPQAAGAQQKKVAGKGHASLQCMPCDVTRAKCKSAGRQSCVA
jgi:hypothetical protein